MNIEINYL